MNTTAKTASQPTRTVPGPEIKPIVGTLHAMDTQAPIQGMMRHAERYGEIFRHQLPTNDGSLFVISSQRLVDELCDESRFDKRVHNPLKNIRAFGGDGLFTARTDEPNWGKAHRILMPAFSPVALTGMYDGMVDIAEQLMLKWERLGPEADVDVTHDFTRLTLDTIALCSFSYRFNSFYSESMHPFIDSMVDALEESGQRGRRLPIQNRLMLLTQRRYDEDIAVLHEVADRIIAHRREHPLPDGQSDILDTMLTATDPKTGETLSDENVRYQMVTFLIAGHETTSGLLSFTLYELLKNPQVMARARAHVDEVLDGRYPTYADLAKLGYLDQILRETLRLWPTAPAFAVYPHESTAIGAKDGEAGYAITPDDTALVLTPQLHRDPSVWPDPERFDPDRFAFDRAQAIPSNAWKPFGNGQRSCIGRGFALQEAQLVLALMLQRFDIDWADPSYELTVKETLTLKPDGFFARFSRREGYAAQAPVAAQGEAGEQDEPAAVERHGTPVRILFGSNAGTSEAFANQVAQRATRLGYAPTVAALDEATGDLPGDGAVVVVSASYEGQPPDNAKQFVSWLEGVTDGALDGVRFAVFGCGNTDWARTYQRIPTLIDEQLERAGATRLIERGEANARGDFFGDFDAWHERLWPAIGDALGVEAAAEAPAEAE
ncbi:MAG: cytochrome P450, partial [Mobilicoccus sp.]|nr:cytochrome P450 [Mobilicoccus sp.]